MDATSPSRNRALAHLMLLAAIAMAPPASALARTSVAPRISVLSSRADMISGGSAMVRVDFSTSRDRAHARVLLGRRSVERQLQRTSARQLTGVITGLKRGANRLSVILPGRRGARLTLTNHPIGGPVLAGPQLQPWTCEKGARDAQCNKPATYSYIYKSSDQSKSGYQTYDPAHPASDVATTKTDNGHTVPFIVRIETGYIDRDQYKVGTLWQPGKAWKPLAPQPQFDHKLLITHGASCGVDYGAGDAPNVTGGALTSALGVPGVAQGAADVALGRGFVVMSNALDNSGHNCNIAVQAESLLMTKEYVVKHYGTLRYTIGTGCSGGSLAEQWTANAYPGLYQGILPTCSFPDAWSIATQFLDYHLMLAYFGDNSKWGTGVAWTEPQEAAVEGHISTANSEVSDNAQWHVAVPTDHCSGISDQQRYDPITNPGGVRCDIMDAAINIFGPRVPAVWTPQEKKIGHGFAGVPIDNVGVQYGLAALQQAQITPAQFVDLNAKLGGINVADASIQPQRITADEPALANAYRSGAINEGTNLDQTAIIDCRGPDPGLFHDAYRAFAMRARLDRAHGNHANQLIWEGPAPIIGDAQCEANSFDEMDRWMSAVERDARPGTTAQKIVRDKPADATDRCYDGNGHKVSDGLCGPAVVPIYGTPRTVAGDSIRVDTNKCQLKPLNRNDDYGPIPFTDAQWAQLQQIFPQGVCDYSKPGVDQQPTIPWQTYQDAHGRVIYGGRALPPPPRSKPFRVRH